MASAPPKTSALNTRQKGFREKRDYKFGPLFYDITNAFYASNNPTENIYFGMWRMHKKLIEVDDGPFCYLSSMAKDMQLKFDKYWSNFNVIISCAAGLDPRFKLERVEYCYEKIYGKTYANEMVSHIRITLMDLFDEDKGVARSSSSPTFATSFETINVPSSVVCGNVQLDEKKWIISCF